MNRIGKRIVGFLTLCAVSVSSFMINPMETNATSKNLQTELHTLSVSLRDIMQNQKNKAIKEIENTIIKNGWDYELTMEDVEQDNPFKEIEYVSMIAAYMTAKNYYSHKGNEDFVILEDVPLITYTTSEETAMEKIPIKIDHFVETADGRYYRDDNGMYIVEDTVVTNYSMNNDGYYSKDGTKEIKLDEREVKFGNIEFHIMTADELLSYYKITDSKELEDYQNRIKNLTLKTNSDQIYQTMFSKTPEQIGESYNFAVDVENYKDYSDERKRLVEIAKTLIGQVPYQWGGKANGPGYDHTWWLFDDNNEQKGLDCSGYVQWVYMTAGYPEEIYNQMISTSVMLHSTMPEITREELQIGDIGVKTGVKINHTGIYVGKIDGKEMWIHCSSGANTVNISEFGFQKFYSPIKLTEKAADSDEEVLILDKNEEFDLDNINELVYSTVTASSNSYSDADVYMLAQLITHEAGNEGLNGWVAVAEVVKNRIESSLFPNTMEEVVYQKGQFSYVNEISKIIPTEEIINTARLTLSGNIYVFDNPACMYFRNPMITDGIDVNSPVDWGHYKYFMAVGNHAFYLQP